MKKTKIPFTGVIYSVLLAIIGILVIIFAIVNKANVEKMVSYSFAAGLFLLALIYILNTIMTKRNEVFSASLVLGSTLVAFGIVLVIDYNLMPNFFILFLAALLVVLAGVSLIKMIIAIVHREKAGLIILYIVAAVITGTIGGLMFAYFESSKTVVYIFMGIMALVSGIVGLVGALKKNNEKQEASAQ